MANASRALDEWVEEAVVNAVFELNRGAII